MLRLGRDLGPHERFRDHRMSFEDDMAYMYIMKNQMDSEMEFGILVSDETQFVLSPDGVCVRCDLGPGNALWHWI